MQKLHLINIPPSQTERVVKAQQFMQKKDAIVFYEDAVLFCKNTQKNQSLFSTIFKENICYVLEADLIARGVSKENCLSDVQVIDYDQWVALTEEFDGTHLWN